MIIAASKFAFPVIAASLLVTVAASDAAPKSRAIENTEDLRKACSSPRDSVEERECLVYIEGATDMMQLIGKDVTSPGAGSERDGRLLPYSACDLPDVDQMRIAFLKWSQDKPYLLKVDPVVGIWQSISFGWHCKARSNPIAVPHEPQ
jgi:hypothetical protein